jgi:SAM-dependent methyltransferase
MATFEYRRLDRWARSESNGWTSADVAARFEAGARGAHYLECLPFGPAIAEHPAARELLEMFARLELDRADLLDFGCGNGVLAQLLAAAGLGARWTYTGVDVNPITIESCRRRLAHCRFETVTEGAPLPFADGSVDVVVASGVLECIERPLEILAEFRRVTRTWVALCRVGIRSATRGTMYWQTVRHDWGFEEHCFHVFERAELQGMFARVGLELIWEKVSLASGDWTAPDEPEPLQHFSLVLRKQPR